MPAGKRPINDRLYLITKNRGDPASSICTIMAHGQQLGASREFTIDDDYTVNLYVDSGAVLVTHAGTLEEINFNSALDAIANGRAESRATFSRDESCPDIKLEKWTRSTSGAFHLKNWLGERGSESYDDLVSWLDHPDNVMASDIVVIRNRPKLRSVTLRQVISELDQFNYSEFRGSCCRATGFGSRKLRQHAIGSNRPGGGTYAQ